MELHNGQDKTCHNCRFSCGPTNGFCWNPKRCMDEEETFSEVTSQSTWEEEYCEEWKAG